MGGWQGTNCFVKKGCSCAKVFGNKCVDYWWTSVESRVISVWSMIGIHVIILCVPCTICSYLGSQGYIISCSTIEEVPSAKDLFYLVSLMLVLVPGRAVSQNCAIPNTPFPIPVQLMVRKF